MNGLTWVVFGYACIVNALGYAWMAADKRRASRRKRRIPERQLFLTAWLGGALGVLIGMYNKRHKTQHVTFTAGIPFILLVNLLVYGFIIIRFG
ncbi:DUF1294 domain-containing protein [Paenibacillus marinisediminis]